MDFYQLNYFKKTAELQSIGQAAKELSVTQPAVSKQIKALEEELGQRLFDRIGKRVFLTRAGELLYSYTERILAAIGEAKTAIRDLSQTCSGDLVIGLSDHIGLHRLPAVLKAYIDTFPEVNLKLRCHRSETVIEMVRKNLLDLGVVTLPKSGDNLILLPIWKDPMSLVVYRGHPLEGRVTVRLQDIAGYDLILPERGTTTRAIIDSLFSQRRLSPRVAMEVAYLETIKVFVKVGLGVSIIPDTAVEEEVKAGSLHRLPLVDAEFSRDLGVVYLREKFLSRAAREFLAILEGLSKIEALHPAKGMGKKKKKAL